MAQTTVPPCCIAMISKRRGGIQRSPLEHRLVLEVALNVWSTTISLRFLAGPSSHGLSCELILLDGIGRSILETGMSIISTLMYGNKSL